MGPGSHVKTVVPGGVGSPAFTMGPVNGTIVRVTEPKIEGRAIGIGVKTPLTVGFATIHGISRSAAHGATPRGHPMAAQKTR